MGYSILRVLSRPEAGDENTLEAKVAASQANQNPYLRDLATGAALAVAVDTSPAVLVTLRDYAESFRPGGRRSA